jgi:hypothetical protein
MGKEFSSENLKGRDRLEDRQTDRQTDRMDLWELEGVD